MNWPLPTQSTSSSPKLNWTPTFFRSLPIWHQTSSLMKVMGNFSSSISLSLHLSSPIIQKAYFQWPLSWLAFKLSVLPFACSTSRPGLVLLLFILLPEEHSKHFLIWTVECSRIVLVTFATPKA